MFERVSDEAKARKQRSEARLLLEGVPFIEHLPVIEDEREAKLRSGAEIVDRAIALLAVAAVGEGAPDEIVDKLMVDFDVAPRLSPQERAFVASPTASARVRFSWRYEALNVLLWATGFLGELSRPVRQMDVPTVIREILSRTVAKLHADARVRPAGAILDEADLIYRYHWAVRDAQLRGEPPPARLDRSVIMERHYALNWLIGVDGCGWDDVPTHT